jgi:hypothetical protein
MYILCDDCTITADCLMSDPFQKFARMLCGIIDDRELRGDEIVNQLLSTLAEVVNASSLY